MDYLKTNLKWEDFFAKESVELEMKMQSLDMETLSKSKIRLSLENKILDWNKYESWVLENLGCASFRSDITESDLDGLLNNLQETLDKYSTYDFWSEDLMPILIWDNQVIVFGIHYNENLVSIPNHIFILAPPEILTFISKKLSNDEENQDDSNGNSKDKTDLTASGIEGLSLEMKPLSFDFKDLQKNQGSSAHTNTPALSRELTGTNAINSELTGTKSISQFTNTQALNDGPRSKSEKEIWEFINERHSEYIFEVKKQFTAYLVLKVDYDNTSVYKMDPDLAKDNINEQLFNYSLKEENPFKRVFESGAYESFSVSQLGLNLKDFKYACITALKSGKKVVGFLVGFKNKNLSEIDQMLLDELAKETAA